MCEHLADADIYARINDRLSGRQEPWHGVHVGNKNCPMSCSQSPPTCIPFPPVDLEDVPLPPRRHAYRSLQSTLKMCPSTQASCIPFPPADLEDVRLPPRRHAYRSLQSTLKMCPFHPGVLQISIVLFVTSPAIYANPAPRIGTYTRSFIGRAAARVTSQT
jgi:hypothetical protein